MPPSDTVWAVMGGGIVIAVYRGPRGYDLAKRHARCITGTDAVPLDVSQLPEALRAIVHAEIRTELAPEVALDIETSEWEETEDVTPVEIEDDLDDDRDR